MFTIEQRYKPKRKWTIRDTYPDFQEVQMHFFLALDAFLRDHPDDLRLKVVNSKMRSVLEPAWREGEKERRVMWVPPSRSTAMKVEYRIRRLEDGEP